MALMKAARWATLMAPHSDAMWDLPSADWRDDLRVAMWDLPWVD
jgi:hypothetical protein